MKFVRKNNGSLCMTAFLRIWATNSSAVLYYSFRIHWSAQWSRKESVTINVVKKNLVLIPANVDNDLKWRWSDVAVAILHCFSFNVFLHLFDYFTFRASRSAFIKERKVDKLFCKMSQMTSHLSDAALEIFALTILYKSYNLLTSLFLQTWLFNWECCVVAARVILYTVTTYSRSPPWVAQWKCNIDALFLCNLEIADFNGSEACETNQASIEARNIYCHSLFPRCLHTYIHAQVQYMDVTESQAIIKE